MKLEPLAARRGSCLAPVLIAIAGCCATQHVYGSKEKFEAFVANQALAGRPVADATTRLTSDGFSCKAYGLASAAQPVLCTRRIAGCLVVEEVQVMLYRSTDGAAVDKVVPGYLPVNGP